MAKKINIPNVTGNIVITMSATRSSVGNAISSDGKSLMTQGKRIDHSTHTIENDSKCWATVDPIIVEQGKTYTIACDATWLWVYSFDENDNVVSQLIKGSNKNPQVFSFTADSTKIRFGCYDPDKKLTYCTITEPKTSIYTISKNLNNCSISNTISTISGGSSYSATITADTGYELNTISVTMGGNNVSSSVVTGNKINISSVTGDIVITVLTNAIIIEEPPKEIPETLSGMTYGKDINKSTGK